MTTDLLTYRIAGNRIEFYFRGLLIVSGLTSLNHSIDCIAAIRHILTGGGPMTRNDFDQAKAIWQMRQSKY